jgi:polysaccharide pyruvyl transferase WcaK-like protein
MLNSVTLLGSSSGRNAGDAALMSAIMDSVDHECGTQLLYEIPTINPAFVQKHYSNRTRPVGMLPWHLSVKMLGLPTYRSVRRTDLSLVFDAILFDRALFNPLFNFLSTLHLLLPSAKRKGRKLGFYNVGVGPVHTGLGRKMLRDLAEAMDFITVRDQESQDILVELGVRNPRILLTADAALNVAHSPAERVDALLRELGIPLGEDILAVNINRYLNTWAQPDARPMSKEAFLSVYGAAVNRVADETGAAILFVATQHHDFQLTQELMSKVDRARRKAFLSNTAYSHYDIAGVLSRAGLLFAMRLHAIILCSSSTPPVLGLAYQPMVQFYFNSLGLS